MSSYTSLEPEVPGFAFDTSTRTFSGTPTKIGLFDMIYKATDSGGSMNYDTLTLYDNSRTSRCDQSTGEICLRQHIG